jgi:hypothetical protein
MSLKRFRIRKNGKYGFIDELGNEVIEPIFEHANNFKEGLAKTSINGKYGFINPEGDFVIDPQYKGTLWFENGLALVINDTDQYGYIDKNGKLKVPFQHYDCQPLLFKEGFACIQKDEKRGFINENGMLAIPNQFDGARNFSEGLAVVKVGNQYGYIDYSGKMVSKDYYSHAEDFDEGFACITKNGKDGIIDSNCNIFVENRYDSIISFYEGIAILYEEDKIFYMNTDKEIIYEMEYDRIAMENHWMMFSEGFAPIYRDGKWGYINSSGEEIIAPFATNNVGSFHEDFASFSQDGKLHGFINTEGRIIIEPKFTGLTRFCYGLACARDACWGYINKSGHFVWKQQPEFDAKVLSP